jgi:LytS/YehU family sensor histidine kinase
MSVILTLVSVYLLSDLFFAVKRMLSDSNNPKTFVLLYFFRDIFMAGVVLICVYVIKGFYVKQAVLIENERLIHENLQSQYQSLKNQVSPHFLFNSLTALKELIDEDPKNARQYLSHLSMLLRYTLQSNENKTVTLFEEMESVRSYIYLIKMRFGENLRVEFKIGDEYGDFRLPPLVIQTLIENAVKHNEISKRNPLTILLKTTNNNSLVVGNPIREKLSLEPGTGIGLDNLSKQYKLLCGEEIRISKSQGEFRVEVPLLKPNGNESSNS